MEAMAVVEPSRKLRATRLRRLLCITRRERVIMLDRKAEVMAFWRKRWGHWDRRWPGSVNGNMKISDEAIEQATGTSWWKKKILTGGLT